ncbi:rRNA maturation factor [Peptoclostridium acidaminophilum DSM 3953]|uniref:Endoribonuclease YbeY n=1 Tax=Peptoclostridium acidaminophilum DSM 3953 TaxID=1286171 RepID=W8T4P3_PEPAC|nr:rRNA maturation RNase YbeY [Peptoclostridium acidaminophilum]AHM56724.1 rRNA maturation factor [Peptoclostridium acidaminophilum DSM 3953]
MNIEITNAQDKVKFEEDLKGKIRSVVEESLKHEGWGTHYEVSILFVDNEEIKRLNSEFRGIDRPTDVLSFPLIGKDEKDEFLEDNLLGDIVISLERALEQSREYGHSFEREIAFLVCHSMFHLMGYDHDNDERAKEMRGKEEMVLSSLGIVREMNEK